MTVSPSESFLWKAVSTSANDRLYGMRVHSWVLVLPGKRDVPEAFFIGETEVKALLVLAYTLLSSLNLSISYADAHPS